MERTPDRQERSYWQSRREILQTTLSVLAISLLRKDENESKDKPEEGEPKKKNGQASKAGEPTGDMGTKYPAQPPKL